MSFSVIPSDKFKKEAKRLTKKYPSLKTELANLAQALAANAETGTAPGHEMYKIRLAVKSKGKGKSGGARVVTYVVTENGEIYLLTIYDKLEFDSVDNKALAKIVKTLNADTSS